MVPNVARLDESSIQLHWSICIISLRKNKVYRYIMSNICYGVSSRRYFFLQNTICLCTICIHLHVICSTRINWPTIQLIEGYILLQSEVHYCWTIKTWLHHYPVWLFLCLGWLCSYLVVMPYHSKWIDSLCVNQT